MSQQSLTFLSQSSGRLFKPAKPEGGTARFHPGLAGTLVLKQQTDADLSRIAAEEKENDYSKAANREMRLSEYHYATSVKLGEERKRLGVLDIPPKPVASIPGYSGFIPRKEAANVIGTTYKIGNLQSAEVFAGEQESKRKIMANILKPASDLKTPETY
mmetsp:Transcript_19118/g.47803  ORF Transcript_19118/g.47803 Transcript_19118/m.47803 type:complete len:159 (-) Transcript_19118:912-1388(-)|eukprot:CAMPEP_0178987196 /NCGR_PEP_ID=MMETSP0795-20121207/3130_1 /TAXON_ID=88552 /ORGANISM="Amoebophrya sp., Strain Ameob2" /LENGTH=158 /DNA_ID=CAMNT_0020678351 /DNA_START=108 /DNA_END=584 /DNA_ORIENTATION=-